MALTKVTGKGLETLSDGVTITVDDNSDTLTLTSTDADANSGPNLRLYRNSSSPADDDFLGTIDFEGRNDNSEDFVAARIFTFTPDVSDGSEDAQLQLSMMKGGSSHLALEIKPDEFIINNGSVDMDFRVEGNGDANMFVVDASADKIGIGTNAPLDLVHLKGGSDNSSTGAPIIRLQKQSGGAVDDGQTIGGISFYVNDDGVESGASYERAKIIAESQNSSSGTRLEFWTGNSNADIAERMRIIADGSVCIGGTSHDPISVAASSMAISQNGDFNINKASGTAAYMGRSGSDGNLMVFYKNTTFVGGISLNSSSTAFNTSSDYRLKENVDYTWDATTRLKQLKPARFNFIADDTNTLVDGFLAHEVSSIVPEAITGTKDAMTAQVLYAEGDELPEGKNVGDVKKPSVIDPQGIDQSKLVPLLVKTIQELEARITALEA
jgi:hypothetical protein